MSNIYRLMLQQMKDVRAMHKAYLHIMSDNTFYIYSIVKGRLLNNATHIMNSPIIGTVSL